MQGRQMDEHVTLTFDKDEALILFELPGHLHDKPAVFIGDNADRLTLTRLCRALENALVEPSMPDYEQILGDARERLNEAWVSAKESK
jgi:hypothetical protein